MSGPNVLPVNAVAANSDISAAARTDQVAEVTVDLPGSVRQPAAGDGKNFPEEQTGSQSKDVVADAVDQIAASVEGLARKLEFSIDEPSGKVVVTVYDSASEEVIRQIPGEQAIAIAERIASLSEEEPVIGLLLDSQA